LRDRINPYVDDIKNQHFDLKIEDLQLIYSCMDLTSLNTTDNESYLKDWLDQNLLIPYKKNPNCKPSVVCVYPSVVGYVRDYLNVNEVDSLYVSSVVGNFPSG